MSKPIGPYTPAKRIGDWVVCSGQIALVDGTIVGDTVGAQVTQLLANLSELLGSHQATLDDVVKTTVFLVSMDDYADMNAAYIAAFGDHRPTRSAVAVAALPAGALVEVEAWAYTGGN